MNDNLKIRKLERDLLDIEVSKMLLKFAQDVLVSVTTDKTYDSDMAARQIVAHCREQISR